MDLGSPKANQDMAVIGTLSCTAQIDSQVLSFITRLWPRRLTVVDEQKGLVFSFPMFQHRGGVRSIKIQGVPGVDVIPMGGGTSNLQAGEIFKIRAGKIHEIEPWAPACLTVPRAAGNSLQRIFPPAEKP